jgi:hypothetical protein
MQGLNKREADATAGSSDEVRDHDSGEQEKTLRKRVMSALSSSRRSRVYLYALRSNLIMPYSEGSLNEPAVILGAYLRSITYVLSVATVAYRLP